MTKEVIPINIMYHDNKYGEVKRLEKIEIGNWIDVYAAKDISIPSIETVEKTRKELINEINFYEKIAFSGIPLCPQNGLTFIENVKNHFIGQLKELEKPILIPLGFSMEIPEGYEGLLLPRSSSFKHFNTIQTNSMGIIDESYKGDNDEWFYPVIGVHKDTYIAKGDKIAQFRIQRSMPNVTFVECLSLGNKDRGGHGSTGKK